MITLKGPTVFFIFQVYLRSHVRLERGTLLNSTGLRPSNRLENVKKQYDDSLHGRPAHGNPQDIEEESPSQNRHTVWFSRMGSCMWSGPSL